MSTRARISLAALVLVLVAAALLGGHKGGGELVGPYVGGPNHSAVGFVDSFGVAMHFAYLDTAYTRQAEVLARLRELGVRHIREGVPVRSPALSEGLRLAARQGLRATLVTDLDIAPDEGVAAGLREMRGRIDGFEAPNELDGSGRPAWRERLDAYLLALRAAVRRRRARAALVGPSFLDLSNYGRLDKSAFDVVSVHPYPGALPPEGPLESQLQSARALVPGKRIAFTETGYHNALSATVGQPPASEEAAAIYLPRALLWSFASGVERTFVYELLDEKPDAGLVDPELHFGLLRQDLSRKPAFLSVRNLIGAVGRSPGRPIGESRLPSVRATAALERVALTRTDGSRVVALWRPVSVWDRDTRRPLDPGPASATLRWPLAARDVTVTRPTLGPNPVMRRAAATKLDIQLGADVTLVSYR